jgi:hypothetical protein
MRTLGRILALAGLSVAFVFSIDALCFRTPFYSRILAPDSSAGYFENVLAVEQRRVQPGPHRVLVCGDSQIAEGFSAKLANQFALSKGWSFDSAAVSGSSVKVWYYMLRAVDPAKTRFDAIAIPFRDYADESQGYAAANREIDLNMVITRLGLSDIPAFVRSFPDPAVRRQVLLGSLLKGVTYRRDLHDFLSSPKNRMREVRFWREHGAELLDNYPGSDHTLAGMRVNWQTGEFNFPPEVPAAVKDAVVGRYASYILRTDPLEHDYRAAAVGRILDLYRNTNVRIVFFKPPQRPLPPNVELPESGSYVASQIGNPRVAILPLHAFDDMQRPEIFADGLHLNSKGRAEFSVRLASEIISALSNGGKESL